MEGNEPGCVVGKNTPVIFFVIVADGLVIDDKKKQISQVMGLSDPKDVSVSVSVSRRMARGSRRRAFEG